MILRTFFFVRKKHLKKLRPPKPPVFLVSFASLTCLMVAHHQTSNPFGLETQAYTGSREVLVNISESASQESPSPRYQI